jgi:hypothetical protein
METKKKLSKEQLKLKAWRNYHLALKRVGKACPKWVKCRWKYKMEVFRIYRKSAFKNCFDAQGRTFHVDHIVPLVMKDRSGNHIGCGLHVPWNLHVIDSRINLAKGTLLVHEWHNIDSPAIRRAHYAKVRAKKQSKAEKRKARTPKMQSTFYDRMQMMDNAIGDFE